MTIKASWIGLGVMGFPMAGHLASNADVEMTVYNRSSEKAEKWVPEIQGQNSRQARRRRRRRRFCLCLRRQ